MWLEIPRIFPGTITSWSDNPDGVGWGFWFKVIDNGEGANADPDEMTRLGNSPGPLGL